MSSQWRERKRPLCLEQRYEFGGYTTLRDFLDRAAEDQRFMEELTRGLIFLQPPDAEGLEEGELLITAGTRRLIDGMRVKVAGEEQPAS